MRSGRPVFFFWGILVLSSAGCSGLLRTDRLLHAAYSADLSCMAGWTLVRSGTGEGRAPAAGALAALSAGIVKELVDSRAEGWHPFPGDPLDLAADAVGCFAGALLLRAAVIGD